MEVLQDVPRQNADRLDLANLWTTLRIVQETKAFVSSVTLVGIEICARPDFSKKQSVPLFPCISGAEWDDI